MIEVLKLPKLPGDVPEDPRRLIKSLPEHKLPAKNLVLDGDPVAISRMNSVLGIEFLVTGAEAYRRETLLEDASALIELAEVVVEESRAVQPV